MKFQDRGTGADHYPPTETSIRLLSITPKAGTPVGEDTALQADLAYSVQDFQPGHFAIIAQFDTKSTSVTTGGDFQNSSFPKSAVGELHFCFPVRDVWKLPNVKRPLTVRFLLNKVRESGVSEAVAVTETVTFASSAEADIVPSSAAATPSDEYDVALMKVHSKFERYAAESRHCADQFPEVARETSESFERWAQKYSSVKTEVDTLFTRWVAAQTGGDVRATQQVIDEFKRIAAEESTNGNPKQLRDRCRRFNRFMASPNSDPEVNLSSELAIIRRGANVAEPH